MADEIALYGTVGAAFWDEEHFTVAQVRDLLRDRRGPLTVRINSGGGVAADGLAIYHLLRDYPGEVTALVDGAAASAASLIAMAAERIVLREGAWLLLHDPAALMAGGRGTAEDHRRTAAFLDRIADGYAAIYAARAGLGAAEARELMRRETLLVGAEAVEAGFADAVDPAPAAAAAAFDYRIYARVPEGVRQTTDRPGPVPGAAAVTAWIAGASRAAKGENPMPMNLEQTEPAGSGVELVADGPVTAATAEVGPVRPDLSGADVGRVYQTAAFLGLPPEAARDAVADARSLAQALDRLTDAFAAAGNTAPPPAARPTARILRDEGDTLRDGIVSAMVAQMARGEPDHAAGRRFMGMGLAEMAAELVGRRGPLRTARDREEMLVTASHSVSDFPGLLGNAMNRRLLSRYRDAAPTYRRIARQETFQDFRPHPIVRAGEGALLAEVPENGEITYATFGEAAETVRVRAYARAYRLSRQMLLNDDLGAIDRFVRDIALAAARTEEAEFYAMFLSGSGADGPTLTTTSRQVFNTTDGSKAATGTTIDVAALSTARAALRKRKGIDGAPIALTPRILLVGPDRETLAQSVVAPIQPAQAGNVNPFSGTLEVVVSAHITGNAWYLLADPEDAPCFVWGLLNGAEGPRVRIDEPFGVQGLAVKVEADFGCGAVDFRGGFKNPGA